MTPPKDWSSTYLSKRSLRAGLVSLWEPMKPFLRTPTWAWVSPSTVHRGREPGVDLGERSGELVLLDLGEQVLEGARLVAQRVPVLGRDLDADVQHPVHGEVGVAGVGRDGFRQRRGQRRLDLVDGCDLGLRFGLGRRLGGRRRSLRGRRLGGRGGWRDGSRFRRRAGSRRRSRLRCRGSCRRRSAAVGRLAPASGRNERRRRQECGQAPGHGHRIRSRSGRPRTRGLSGTLVRAGHVGPSSARTARRPATVAGWVAGWCHVRCRPCWT